MRLGFFATAVAISVLAPVAAGAQTFTDLANPTGDAFTVAVAPQYPLPHTSATVSVSSDSLDLSGATLTVAVGGREVYKGAVRPVSVPLGAAGSAILVKVTVSSMGSASSQTLVLAPQDVALVVEPLSSAPPLYPGKPGVPLEGSVRVVAVANLRDAKGVATNPSANGYAWTVDGVRIVNSSGVGKSSIIVASPLQYRMRDVSVVVTSSSGTLVGGAATSLSPVDPTLRVYENDPLLGIRYGRALSNTFTLAGAESTLYAAPFSLSTVGGAPLIQWFLNGSLAQTGSSITLRPTGSGRGSASLSLTASSGGLASALANLSIFFGAQSNTNFLGL